MVRIIVLSICRMFLGLLKRRLLIVIKNHIQVMFKKNKNK